MGLFGWLRGKQEEDPILGGRSEPTGLEVRAVDSATTTTTARVGEPPVDPDELTKVLQDAGGDPAQLAERLRTLFPGAQVDVQTQSYQSGVLPPGTEQMIQQFFGAAGAAAAGGAGAASDDDDDPIAQIERLAELHKRGALSDAEFAAAKAKILGG